MANKSSKAAPTKPARQGVRNAQTEQMLEDEGVHFEYVPDFPVANIDREASLHNQARITEEFNADWVEEYREAMRRGAIFPALVVAKPGAKAKGVNIDGNHRFVAAIEEGVETFGAYVVKIRPGSLQFKSLSAMANARHGHQAPEKERIQHAIWAIDNRSVSMEKAASEQNLPLSTLKSNWDKVRADRRAVDVGIRQVDWDGLAATARTRLLTIGTDEGFKAATRLAIAAQMKIVEIDAMLAALAEHAKSASAQERIVRQWRKDFADQIAQVAAGERRSGRGGFTPRSRVSMALTSLMALPDDFLETTVASWEPSHRSEAAEQARLGSKRLADLAAALEA